MGTTLTLILVLGGVFVLVVVATLLVRFVPVKKKNKKPAEAENGIQPAGESPAAAESVQGVPAGMTEEVAATMDVQPEKFAAKSADGTGAAKRLTFKEAYEALNDEQKKYFDGIRDYALGKKGAELNETKVSLTVHIRKNPILKLKIRRGTTIAAFKVESGIMRDFKRQAETTEGIKEKETEIRITGDNIFATACEMVDLMVKQIGHERQAARERINAQLAQTGEGSD